MAPSNTPYRNTQSNFLVMSFAIVSIIFNLVSFTALFAHAATYNVRCNATLGNCQRMHNNYNRGQDRLLGQSVLAKKAKDFHSVAPIKDAPVLGSAARNPLRPRMHCDAKNIPPAESEPWCPIGWCYGFVIEDNPCAFGSTYYCSDPREFLYRREFIAFHSH